MRDRVREFFDRQMKLPGDGNGAGGRPTEQPAARHEPDPATLRRLHIAACALLLELAHADDEFSPAERMHIEAVLRRHFRLDEATALELMEVAELAREEADGPQVFARLIRDSYDQGQKTLLAEIMWGVILSDGDIALHEGFMLRQITAMLELEPGYLSAMRKRSTDQTD